LDFSPICKSAGRKAAGGEVFRLCILSPRGLHYWLGFWFVGMFCRARRQTHGAPLAGGALPELLLILNELVVVEAAGVEPASEKARRVKPTCVSDSIVSAIA
jgi:hypothetical protein